MSILIKGMEMPNKKNGAVLIIYPDGKCAFEDGKTYQAVPIPKHGRLIDADALIDYVAEKYNAKKVGEQKAFEMADFALFDITDAPTIIPAEEGE